MLSQKERCRGAMIGLAVGDALGAPVEFQSRPVFVTDYQEAKNWKIPAGAWTDDTAQALCLAEGLLNGCDEKGFMDLFVRWMEQGHNSSTGKAVGIGGTVLKTLMTYRVTGQIRPPTDEHSSGNGCIMRLAPVVIYHNWRLKLGTAPNTTHAVINSAKLTHGSKTAENCTRYFGAILDSLIAGWSKEASLRHHYAHGDELRHLYQREYEKKTAEGTIEHQFGNVYHSEAQLKSDGYCVNTLECALWAFYHSETFEDGMIKAIGLGGDTDTVGAVYGQLAGAHYGYSAIPQRWRDGLVMHDVILDYADRLMVIPDEDLKKLDERIQELTT
jgi:ADP-ribosylglycohydrolase